MNIGLLLALLLGFGLLGSGIYDIISGESELWLGHGRSSVVSSSSVASSSEEFASYVALKILGGCLVLYLTYKFND